MRVRTCVFCNELSRDEGIFAETSLWSARWDKFPATPGHAEIIPKRHVQYFDDLTDDERDTLLRFTKQVKAQVSQTDLESLYGSMLERANTISRPFLKRALSAVKRRPGAPDAFNLGLNDGPDAGQSVHHFHLHLMPRWHGDTRHLRGGVRNLFARDAYKDIE